MRVDSGEHISNSLLKVDESEVLVVVLVFEEYTLKATFGDDFLELRQSDISHVVHPFGHVHFFIVLFVLVEGAAADVVHFFLAKMEEKMLEKDQTSAILLQLQRLFQTFRNLPRF